MQCIGVIYCPSKWARCIYCQLCCLAQIENGPGVRVLYAGVMLERMWLHLL